MDATKHNKPIDIENIVLIVEDENENESYVEPPAGQGGPPPVTAHQKLSAEFSNEDSSGEDLFSSQNTIIQHDSQRSGRSGTIQSFKE